MSIFPARHLTTMFECEVTLWLLEWQEPYTVSLIAIIVIFLDFHSTKQGLPLVDSWSRGLD